MSSGEEERHLVQSAAAGLLAFGVQCSFVFFVSHVETALAFPEIVDGTQSPKAWLTVRGRSHRFPSSRGHILRQVHAQSNPLSRLYWQKARARVLAAGSATDAVQGAGTGGASPKPWTKNRRRVGALTVNRPGLAALRVRLKYLLCLCKLRETLLRWAQPVRTHIGR